MTTRFRRSDVAPTLAIFALFVLVGVARALRHELTIDEAQAWAIAVDSANPIEVFDNTRLEGHPAAWHLLLWVVSRISTAAIGLKVVAVLLSSMASTVIVCKAPFPAAVRWLLALSYFPFFEYQIIARTYSLSLLAVVLFCTYASRPRPRFGILVAATLFGTWASALTGLLFGMLWLWLLVRHWPTTEDRGRLLKATGLVLLGAGTAAFQVLLPRTQFSEELSSGTLAANQAGPAVLVKAAVPTLRLRFGDAYDWLIGPGVPLFGVATLALFFAIAIAARFDRRTSGLWILGAPTLMAVAGFTGLLSVHDDGHLFLLGMASVWLARSDAKETPVLFSHNRRLTRSADVIAVASVALSAVMAVWISASDWQEPYSPSTAAADQIKKLGLEDATLITDRPERTVGVLVTLNRDAFLINVERVGRHADQDAGRRPDTSRVLAALEERSLVERPTVLIASSPVVDERLVSLGEFSTTLFGGDPADDIHLYRWLRVATADAPD